MRTVNEGSLLWAADGTHKGQRDKVNDSKFKPFGIFFSFRYELKKKNIIALAILESIYFWNETEHIHALSVLFLTKT